jgi:hypothetical protein
LQFAGNARSERALAVTRPHLSEIEPNHPMSINMTPHIPEEMIDWSPFAIMGNSVPPRDPDEDEEDEEEEDRADEPPVVREPDED